ncbi:restriction endonuclease subunit S [Gordonia polyisoprenivorans]|uniref:restriction endonuclease subunit S n=1 Tax=Gordonia polyisoprenivorans TaxID=84595 RepID=UPI000B99ED31|nr:restriction endonuclease subunit S [Gordonia polyisoprenivorans]OZC33054.1 hypothetical protein CJJ17_17360 [Gordonia polyisoprenivorans]
MTTVKLGDICGFITKGATPTTYGFAWEATGVPFLRSECVSDHGLDMRQSMYISESANKVLRRSQVVKGDILMTLTGNVGRVVLLEDLDSANINQHIARIRITDAAFDPGYVYHYLSQSAMREYYESIVTGQAYPQISLAQVRATEIPKLAYDEQVRLRKSLDSADRVTYSLERLIAKKQAIKQGMMQQLLTGRTRLPGCCEKWSPVRLSDEGGTFGGLVGKTKADFDSGSATFVTFTEVMAAPRLLGQRLARVRVRSNERQNQVLRGDVLFNGSSETPEEVALAAVVDFEPTSTTFLNSFCFGYRLKTHDRIDPTYLAYYFRSGEGRETVFSLAQGATRYNISKTKLMNAAVILPPVDEQREIVDVLLDSEAELSMLHVRLARARDIKTGMMQQLLTGRTRLPVEGES